LILVRSEVKLMTVFVVALVLGAAICIASATGLKWRLVNLGFILTFTGLGFGVGYLFGGQVAIPLAVSVGAASAAGCAVWNKWRKQAARGIQSASAKSAKNQA
jgi:hypothetical protein